ncbi:MAG TPA: hypothetical protein VHE13_16830 [Opitutus sp.]|nr:hypothetical protein [Opitutus sp.]
MDKSIPDPSSASGDPAPALDTCLAEALMMQRYFSEILKVQQTEPALRVDASALCLAFSLHRAVQKHAAQLTDVLETRPDAQALLLRSCVHLSGMFFGFICKSRAHEARAILHGDYALLNAAVLNYRQLLHAAREADDATAARLAQGHLRTLRKFIGQIERLLCPRPAEAVANPIEWAAGVSLA